jgi:predicted nuclease of predicted toxin-antitoxin system
VGLLNATDMAIWNFAKENNFCIVTFDYDFIDFSILKGAPPKIIIIRKGNTKTENIVSLLQSHQIQIHDFLNADLESTFLEII